MKYLKSMFVLAVICFLALPAVAQQPAAQPGAKIREHIESMDADKDGKVSKDEYVAKCGAGDCAKKFDTMDANKDGFLTKEEAQEITTQTKEKAKAAGTQFREQVQNKMKTRQENQ